MKSKSLEPNETINVTLQIDNGELEEVGPSDWIRPFQAVLSKPPFRDTGRDG